MMSARKPGVERLTDRIRAAIDPAIPTVDLDPDDNQANIVASGLLAREPQHAHPDARSLIIPRHSVMIDARCKAVQRIL
jgi:hypothetical protein